MSYSIEFEIHHDGTDPNRLQSVNWHDKHSRFEKVKREIALLTHGRTPETPLTHFEIEIIRHGPKTFDWDNLIASLKPVIDGLTLSGIIFNDSWEFIKNIKVDQKKSQTEKKLTIKVSGESDGRIPKKSVARTKRAPRNRRAASAQKGRGSRSSL